jgi:hypothetical protein
MTVLCCPAAFRAPEVKTTHRKLARGVKIAQIVACACQSARASQHKRSVILLPRQRINSLSNLHRGRQLVGDEGVAPLTHQRRVQEQGAVDGMTKGLGPLVTNSRLRRREATCDREI